MSPPERPARELRCPPDGFCGGEGTADCPIHGEHAAEVALESWAADCLLISTTLEQAFHAGWIAARLRPLPPGTRYVPPAG